MQIALFAPQKTPVKKHLNARNAKKVLERLRTQLTAAQEDLAQCEYNLREVEMHQRASRKGIVDENWWDGAIRFGIWHNEEGMTIREDGRYPIKVNRWIRHILCTLHAERHDIEIAIADLQPQVEDAESLFRLTEGLKGGQYA